MCAREQSMLEWETGPLHGAEPELWDSQSIRTWKETSSRIESHVWGFAPVPTGNSEVTLGACNGLPWPAQRQQKRCLG